MAEIISLAFQRAIDALSSSLAKSENGPRASLSNCILVMRHDPVLSKVFGYNEFSYQAATISAPPPVTDDSPIPGPYPRSMRATDRILARNYVQRAWIPNAAKQDVDDAIETAAMAAPFHPVRQWLASLSYDGKPRLDQWLLRAFGATDDDYHRFVGAKFLIAAVGRVLAPGCKFDHMPVLEGPQDIGKSRALRALFSDDWFSDSLPDLSSRDASIGLKGKWCIEFAELEQMIRSEHDVVKAFLTRQVEHYKPMYGRDFVDEPRQCVFVGTTNETDYLRDATGNKRFWPIRCQYADVQWIIDTRDQLFAEAYARAKAGEQWTVDDAPLIDAIRSTQSTRLQEEVWASRIWSHIGTARTVTLGEVMTALGIPVERQEMRHKVRISNVLRSEGWRAAVRWENGRAVRIWAATDTDG